MTIRARWRRWAREDAQVSEAALRRNLHALGVAAWVVVALNALHVVVFGTLHFDDAVRSTWAQRVAGAHAVMAVVMLVTGWLARRLQARDALPDAAAWLPVGISALVLGWAIALTAFDQAIGGSLSAYVNAAIAVPVVVLLRPQLMVTLMALAWGALAVVLRWVVEDAALLTTHRMNAASTSVLAALVGVLFWRHFVRTERLQRALANSNRQLQAQHHELQALATRDPLTGLLNRRAFEHEAQQALARARRQRHPLALLMLDVDHFKAINDRHGHPAGDAALRQVAACMAEAIRQTDPLARLGGEEFVLLLPDTGADQAWHLAEKLRHTLEQMPLPAIGAPLTVSIGLVTVAADAAPTLEGLLQQADQALYAAKRQGRNRTVTWDVEQAARGASTASG
ncbi:MAG: GGDEF domain-containing protein [Pseudomonadota bacterium]